jgi:hypothetical protein
MKLKLFLDIDSYKCLLKNVPDRAPSRVVISEAVLLGNTRVVDCDDVQAHDLLDSRLSIVQVLSVELRKPCGPQESEFKHILICHLTRIGNSLRKQFNVGGIDLQCKTSQSVFNSFQYVFTSKITRLTAAAIRHDACSNPTTWICTTS